MSETVGDTYRVRLRSLEWASELVRELRHSEDADAVSVATHWALDAVYDLFEAYRQVVPIGKQMKIQDEWLEENAAETIGGIVFIRGEKTHKAAPVKGSNPFGKNSENFAEFAGLTNWVWAEATTTNPKYLKRFRWYSQNLLGRPLWVPLDHAWYWFATNSPLDVPGQAAMSVPGWIEGISPKYRE